MKVLNKAAVDVLLAIMVVIGSTFLSADLKLSGACAAITDGFYDGLRVDGKKQPSVASSLRTLCDTADELAVIGSQYGHDTSVLTERCSVLKKALASEDRDIGGLYLTYADLYSELRSLESELEKSDLSDRHRDDLTALEKKTDDTRTEIENSGYNVSVGLFLRENDRFPARQFASLFHIVFPAAFA